jgi:hypothetical protein
VNRNSRKWKQKTGGCEMMGTRNLQLITGRIFSYESAILGVLAFLVMTTLIFPVWV